VRLGLLAIGIAFAVVGAGLVASFFLVSSSSPPGAIGRTITASQILPNQSQTWTLNTVGAAHGTLTLSWTSSFAANVSLTEATGCSSPSGVCPVGDALADWNSQSTGSWKQSGSVASLYLLTVTDRSTDQISFNATLAETYSTPPFGLGATTLILITIGSILLLGTGAVGVFLGLFLPGGVYEPAPPPRRRVDIYGDLGDETDEFEDDTDGPPN
jgi:hypothetical protein